MDKKVEVYLDWIKDNESGVVYSELWKEMKNSFEGDVNRGYGINTYRDYFVLMTAIIKLDRLKGGLEKILNRTFSFFYALVSLILTRSRVTYKRFGFQYAENLESLLKKTNKDFFAYYSQYNKTHGEYYSYSGMRVLYYYFLAKNYCPNEDHAVLEIGAGMANFSIIHSRNVKKFSYVIVDIPEIIPAAYSNAKRLMDGDVEIFLPFEYQNFVDSSAPKKVIWLLPSQMHLLGDNSFDFFCNTESFAEMNPIVSQSYWEEVERLLRKNAFAFLVNRISRFTGNDSKNYNDLSSPFRLSADKLHCTDIMVDEFRASIKKFEDQPNLVFIFQSTNFSE